MSENGNETWIEKIQKLLNQAEGTDNPDEAETFAEAAQRLMLKHSIDEAALAAYRGDQRREEVIKVKMTFTGTMASANTKLAHCVALGLGLKSVQSRDWQVKSTVHVYIVGFETDARMAEVLIASLMIQANRAAAKRMDPYMARQQRFKWKRSFVMGFGEEVCRRLDAMRKSVVKEATDADADGRLLPALMDREQQLTSEFNLLFPNLRYTRSRSSQDWGGYGAGGQAGRDADINQPRIGSRKALGR